MSQSQATQQSDNIVPPRRDAIIPLSVDSTARPYDLTAIALGAAYGGDASADYVFVTLLAEGGDVYFHFSNATHSDLNDATTISAGSALAFAHAYGQRLVKDSPQSFRLQRNVDKFLIVKTASGTATLRFNASSEPSPSALAKSA